jgi:hypothetical protein
MVGGLRHNRLVVERVRFFANARPLAWIRPLVCRIVDRRNRFSKSENLARGHRSHVPISAGRFGGIISPKHRFSSSRSLIRSWIVFSCGLANEKLPRPEWEKLDIALRARSVVAILENHIKQAHRGVRIGWDCLDCAKVRVSRVIGN